MSTKKYSILVVEDEASLRNAQKITLTQEGYTVFEAGDGVDALERAIREHPDLILLDLTMPKMGGIEFLQKLRKDKWGNDAKVFIFTNGDDASTLPDAIKLGVHNYLIKSETRLDKLVELVRSAITTDN